jgi:heme O synthase-like polyprenyltransferase
MTWQTALALGRISNLPTVWTNVLAGIVLAGGLANGNLPAPQVVAALVSLSLLYIAGMYLNDAFDRDFDRQHRPERPIPSGKVSAELVFGVGFALLAGGVALLALCGVQAAIAAAILAGVIVLYDAWHKGNPASPLLMGVCRLLAYVSAGLAVAPSLPEGLWVAALVSFCWLIGLTYVAKQETLARIGNLWPLAFLAAPVVYGALHVEKGPLVLLLTVCLAVWAVLLVSKLMRRGKPAIPEVVVGLIAGISLVDALFAATHGAMAIVVLAVAAFGLTLGLQRWVAGT